MARRMSAIRLGSGVIAAALLTVATPAQELGTAPPLMVDAPDLYAAFHLPALKDTPDGGLISVFSTTQVGTRAKALRLSAHSPLEGWSAAATLIEQFRAAQPENTDPAATFSGSTAAALNKFVASGVTSVAVTAPVLTVDQPIELNRDGVLLDLRSAVLSPAGTQPYMLRIEHARGVSVTGGRFASGSSGILVNLSNDVRIANTVMHDLSLHGIVVTGSSGVHLSRNRISAVSGAPILLDRGTSSSLVEGNEISANRGYSNITAGIVISDREVDLAANPAAIFGPDGYWVISQPMSQRQSPPHDNVVAFNRVTSNLASGIYVDGGVRNVIVSNTIEGNAKEGLCLDNGSTANVVSSNVIRRNGDRWGQPDWVLTADHVMGAGRLTDGTAAAKVPGISIDNAIYNIVFANNLSHNFGGGIKIVRTGFFNLIGLNTLFSNNDGAGASFHFFGIELGAAEGDDASGELDFTPSRGNIVFSNLIRGDHYSGIFFAAGSDQNDIFDNTIMDAQAWGLESVAVMANDALNNLTNLRSRNIGSGLDPVLLQIGQPAIDGAPGQ